MTEFSGLLVKVRGNGRAFEVAIASLAPGSLDVEPILSVPAQPAAEAVAATRAATWLRMRAKGADSRNPWDQAHDLLDPRGPFAAAGAQIIEAIEPDLEQSWDYQGPAEDGRAAMAASHEEFCGFDEQDQSGGQATGPGVAWNLGDSFSQLSRARARVGNQLEKILVAHLDTGFDPAHVTLPAGLRKDLQRNFVKSDGSPDDASDKTPPGSNLVRNRGHGSGTLSLLAGNKLDGMSPSWPGFKDYVGGAPLVQIMPVRIANWVVRFTTGTMVQGFDYARMKGAHVLSMSMGGFSSSALVDAVNLAYDHGVVLVTAAGNNIAGTPTPKSIVFPARYRRVLAACGVMADGRAYAGLRFGSVQGNYGPASKMDTALAAYTPNVPWAQIDCGKVVDMNGAGTSAATPQIAAAAALWLAEHRDALGAYPEPWMRVEAVRHALFSAAQKSTGQMDREETHEKLGQGVMRADAALDIRPLPGSQLRKLPQAQPSWPWLDFLTGGGVSLARGVALSSLRRAMLALELTQMAQRVRDVEAAIDDPDRPAADIPASPRSRYLEAALNAGNPSEPLRAVLEGMLGRTLVPGSTLDAGGRPPKRIKRRVKERPVPSRRLRVFALDPSVAKRLDSIAVNETTLTVPWDEEPNRPLLPGPVGEYLEVVDVDPASNKVYDPVDLNHGMLLAQDGWSPSEGNPEFHQQMVYAVGMTTITHFEQALGRRALWAPRYTTLEDGRRIAYDVPRLRIYPHALRANNAYYSPSKVALLFGYFPADSRQLDATVPGSMVFSCLSSDIIAHEMSHALLDGLHRRFQEASNPDVPAFHEAFADIVALFQHFTMPELVRFEIGRARGDLSVAALLGGLARQFGEGNSLGGPLRNYLDPKMATLRYEDTREPHDRGSILVFAVYEAFRRIVARRTDDLIRLATGGLGVLPAGALHPDLVNRLTEETCKTAKHVLRMCIRALDCCPAVDITFGEYLRALITADADLVANDRYGYRVAFMEAFRNRGILPRDVRTISTEALTWNTMTNPRPKWLKGVLGELDLRWSLDMKRSEIFALNETNRWKMWAALKNAMTQEQDLCAELGLLPDLPRYGPDGQVLRQPATGETTFDIFSVRPARRVAPDGTFRTEAIAVVHQRRPIQVDDKDPSKGWFWFRGGATLVLDPRPGHEEIRYSIIKNTGSASRLERQRTTAGGTFLSPLRALYFGGPRPGSRRELEPFAAMHADHRGNENG
jgi:hypothetical protein